MTTVAAQFGGLSGRRVLITGSSRGIGAHIAAAFGRQGAIVGIHYNRRADAAQSVAQEVDEAGGTAHLLAGDLHDGETRQTLVDRFAAAAGGIDVLVNNAGGVDRYVSFMELDDADWDRSMTLNAKTAWQLSVAACRHMEPAKFGRIVNISTTAIKFAGASSVHYTAAKAAMESVASAVARWGADHNILVNTIRCGLIDTGMRESVAGYSEEKYRQREALVPLGHAGTPDDVAALVLFLASDAAAFVTREVWAVAGGD